MKSVIFRRDFHRIMPEFQEIADNFRKIKSDLIFGAKNDLIFKTALFNFCFNLH